MSNLTAVQRVRWLILLKMEVWGHIVLPEKPLGDEIDEFYEELDNEGSLIDAKSEVRDSGVETELQAPGSRNYESVMTARECPDGVWVAWPYFTGGGKWGDPEGMEWIEHAVLVACEEKQITIIKRTFTPVIANA